MYKVMLLDDEINVLHSLNRILSRNKDLEVELFSLGKDAIRRAQVCNFDVFISDFHMPEMDGIEFLRAVKEIQPEAMRIILSGFADLEVMMKAINEVEIFRFIPKPWDNGLVEATVANAISLRQILVENRHLADEVREQRKLLDHHESILETLELKNPGITKVDFDDDGAIILYANDR